MYIDRYIYIYIYTHIYIYIYTLYIYICSSIHLWCNLGRAKRWPRLHHKCILLMYSLPGSAASSARSQEEAPRARPPPGPPANYNLQSL